MRAMSYVPEARASARARRAQAQRIRAWPCVPRRLCVPHGPRGRLKACDVIIPTRFWGSARCRATSTGGRQGPAVKKTDMCMR